MDFTLLCFSDVILYRKVFENPRMVFPTLEVQESFSKLYTGVEGIFALEVNFATKTCRLKLQKPSSYLM